MPPLNAFIGKPEPPTSEDLDRVLGPCRALWQQLVTELDLVAEWNSYSRKAGWALRLKQGKRNILYLSPLVGSFRASLVLGGKAVEAAYRSDLPEEVLKVIRSAKRYAEGTGVVLDVGESSDLAAVHALVKIKIAH